MSFSFIKRLSTQKAAVLGLALMLAPALLAVDPVFTSWGVAIRGYDPVAYFLLGKPEKGSKAFVFKWNDAEWRFANENHLQLFKQDPERYAPQYGGYCAYAVSQNSTASIDPESWKIVEGKLYLNYSAAIQKKWEADIPGYIEKADINWPKLLKK